MPTRPKVLEFDVAVAVNGTAHSALGGSGFEVGTDYCRRAGLEMTGSGSAHGVVTRRDEDGMYAFVEVDAAFDVELDPAPGADAARELVERAERGCFVANSLRVPTRARWVVNGEELA